MDDAGDENTKPFSIDINSNKVRYYTPFKNVITFFNDEFKQSPDEIIIELISFDQYSQLRFTIISDLVFY